MTPVVILLRRFLPKLFGAAAVAGVIAGAVTTRSSPGVDVVVLLTVYPPEVATVPVRGGEQSDETAFDLLRAADVFAETVASWVSSPEFVSATYARAKVELPSPSVTRLDRLFGAQKRGGQVVSLRFRSRNRDGGEALASAAVEEVNMRADAFNRASRSLAFTVSAARPVIAPVVLSPLIRGSVAGIVVFFFGLNSVLFWDFLRSGAPGERRLGQSDRPPES